MRVLTVAGAPALIAKYAGAKGRNLHRLSGRGLDIPQWAVISTAVFVDLLRSHQLEGELRKIIREAPRTAAERARELITLAEVDGEIKGVIREAYAAVGGGRVAVRSSGDEEDGAELSFAGQFATFLNVEGVPAIVEHVKRCWASTFSERSLRYRREHGRPVRIGGMAVLVQRMVDAERSGVLFTANPSGGPDEMMINSVFGLGEGLVSGGVAADTFVVDRAGRLLRGTAGEQRGPSLTSAQLGLLAAAGERIEEVFGKPQDVEWAMAGGRLWILQSRPITPFAERVRPETATVPPQLVGTGCSPGTAEGEALVLSTPVEDVGDGVVVTRRADPDWIAVLPTAAALLIEGGSPLSHVAIVARELGVPTVVQIEGLTERVTSGMRLRVDGDAGAVWISP